MQRARLVPLVLTAALTGAGIAAAVAPSQAAVRAADDTPGYSVTAISVDTLVGPNNDQACKVDADLYKPNSASASHPVPAILTTHGFGGNKADSNQTAIAKSFVNAGYAVLSYSGLGFGSSGCKITLDDPDWDGKAGKQLVDVLAGDKTYTPSGGTPTKIDFVSQEKPGDPRVGMIGGSYGGQIQFAVASQDPRIDALIPIITWNDLSYSLAPNNTSTTKGVTYATPGVAKKQWIDLFSADGIASGVSGVQTAGDPDTLGPCPNFADQACPSILQLNTAGYPDDATLAFARHASVASYMSKIKAPTLLAQGEADTLFNLQESVATYKALKAQGTPTRLIWQSWGHSYGTPAPGELDLASGSLKSSYEGRRFLNWMNHYVRGNAKAPLGPQFSYFRPWIKYDTSAAHAGTAVAKAYATSKTFSQKLTETLYLSRSDKLVRKTKNIKDGTAQYANTGPSPTSYSETSGLEGGQVNNPPSDTQGTFASWTSHALARPAVMVGSPKLTVHLSDPVASGGQAAGPGGQLVLFAKIYDVAPDGTITLLHRLIAPARVTDVDKPVKVTLPGVVERFAKGHRIRLVLAASDAAYAGNAAPQPVSVTTGPSAPSTLRLPLLTHLQFVKPTS